MRQCFVYILASHSRRLYVGCTIDLPRRLAEHRARRPGAHTARYHIDRLVYFEQTSDVRAAIGRERQLEGWLRARKVALIEQHNPAWRDLGVETGLVPATRTPSNNELDPSLRSG